MTRTGSDRRLAQPPPEPPRVGAGWPRYLDPPLVRPRDAVALGAAVAVAVAFDLAIRAGIVGVGGALAIAVACAALSASGRIRNPPVIGAPRRRPAVRHLARAARERLAPSVRRRSRHVRSSCSRARSRRAAACWTCRSRRVVARAIQAATQAVLAPAFLLAGGSRREHSRVAGVVRGLLIAIPVLLVFGVLLRIRRRRVRVVRGLRHQRSRRTRRRDRLRARRDGRAAPPVVRRPC